MSNITIKKTNFTNDLILIFALQTVFQLSLYLVLEYATMKQNMQLSQYLFISSFFFIFLTICFSLKYAIANKVLTYLFSIQIFFLAINPIIFFVYESYFNLYNISNAFLILLTTAYLFFYSISPRKNKTTNYVIFAFLLTFIISFLTYYDIGLVTDYSKLGNEFQKTLDALYLSSYNIFLINLSLLIFVWIIYSQGQYILSEYLSSVMAMHTLLVLNEVYQLFNFKHLIENYISGMVFNSIINIGLILTWLIRLNYISRAENKKNEKYVLNYDLLKGFLDKPFQGIWGSILTKLGKQNLFMGSFFLLCIILIPVIFLGDIHIFNRLNIILMFLFVFIVLVYAIIYTQKRWYDHVGFLFKKSQK